MPEDWIMHTWNDLPLWVCALRQARCLNSDSP